MFTFINRLLDRGAERLVGAPQPQQPQTVELNRLTQAQYEAFEKKVHAVTIVNQTTTELQAGYQLGMQQALKVLREGWVV